MREGEEVDVLDILASLVDKSLVQAVEAASEEIRFTLLETIREYAQDCLGKHDEVADAQRRHAQFYLRVAEEAEPQKRAEESVAGA